MRSNNKTVKALKKAVKAKDYAAIQSGTKTILANMVKFADSPSQGQYS